LKATLKTAQLLLFFADNSNGGREEFYGTFGYQQSSRLYAQNLAIILSR
jgi:hypothetical protein